MCHEQVNGALGDVLRGFPGNFMGLLDGLGLQGLPELGINGLYAGDVILEFRHVVTGEAGIAREVFAQVSEFPAQVQVNFRRHVVTQVAGALFDHFGHRVQAFLNRGFLLFAGFVQYPLKMVKLLVEQRAE